MPKFIRSGLEAETLWGAFMRTARGVGRPKNAPRVSSKLRPTKTKAPDLVSERLEKIIGDLVASERVQPHLSVVPATDPECHRQNPAGVSRSEARFLRPPATKARTVSRYPAWKRALDVLFIALAAPIWLPLMFVVMLWIAFASRGPIFYVQERVGYRERRFMMFKFRTMHVNVETQTHEQHLDVLIRADRPMVKLDSCGDKRLIRCGRFLRCTGLDELPQLVNVLRGEMSLVGPRPCTLSEFQRYRPFQRERFNAPPGLTGFWQVNGKNKTTFSEMIAMDVFYTKHMSIGVDLLILLKTFPTLIAQTLESRAVGSSSTRPRIAEKAAALSGERSRSI